MFQEYLSTAKEIWHRTRTVFGIAFDSQKGLFWFAFSLYAVAALLAFLQPYIFSQVFTLLGGIGGEAFRWQPLAGWLGLLGVSFLLSAIIVSFAIRYSIEFLNHTNKALTFHIYQKLLFFDITLHENESSGKYLAKLHRATNRIQGGIDILLYQFAPAIIQLLFVMGAMLYLSFSVGLIFLAGFLVLFAYIIWTSVYLFRIFDEAFEQEGVIGGYFVETLSHIRTIRFFGKEDYYRSEGDGTFDELVTLWNVHFRPMVKYLILKFGGIYLQVALLIGLSVYLFVTGEIGSSAFIFLLVLSPIYLHALESLAHHLHKFADLYASIGKYYDILSLVEEVKDRDDPRPLPEPVRGAVRFEHITFRYAGAEHDQFKDFSVAFSPKRTTAIVGASGSGKSSLIKLLFRLYDVQEGSITLDGIDIRQFGQREYRQVLAIVPQDVELFNASIRDNILMGDVFADDEVWAALRLAVLDERVRQMPKGLETEVGERGVKLSGGEKQRLGIARALIRKPRILVLDEATSSLDTLSERQVKEAIYNLERLDITVIVIAHRLSTIQDADEILVFEKGKVVERGTHAELLAKQGKYAELQGEQILNV